MSAVHVPQLARRREGKPRTAHAQRMTECNGSAVGIHVLGIVRQTEVTQHRQRLRGECLVELDDIEILDREAGTGQQFLRGRNRAEPHGPRGHPCRRGRSDLGQRLASVMRRWPEVKIHLYGKEWRPGRKVGHVTALGDDLDEVRAISSAAAELLTYGDTKGTT